MFASRLTSRPKGRTAARPHAPEWLGVGGPTLQGRPGGADATRENGQPGDRVASLVNDALSSAGQHLRPGIRRDMEQRFRFDFGKVRLHADETASASAAALGARAYAVGAHIVLRHPSDMSGDGESRRVLAHELTHVVQQNAAAPGRGVQVGLGDRPPGPRLSPVTHATQSQMIIHRMAACPGQLHDNDPAPPGWKPYFGPAAVFHCGFRTILENRAPTPDDPENECVYDHSGALVDANHPYAGCRGTPDQYDSKEQPLLHATIDSGGIVRAGADAFITSRVHDIDESIATVIGVGMAAGAVLSSIADAVGSTIAIGVLSGIATCDPANWTFQGLPARSIGHLNVMGAVLSFMWTGRVQDVLGNLTRRLDSYPITNLLQELARDINETLASKGVKMQVTAATLGVLSLYSLVDWLQVQGLLAYRRPPEVIARELAAPSQSPSTAGQ